MDYDHEVDSKAKSDSAVGNVCGALSLLFFVNTRTKRGRSGIKENKNEKQGGGNASFKFLPQGLFQPKCRKKFEINFHSIYLSQIY